MLECPVGAISLVFGTSARGIDLPEVNSTFETSRPGVHIVGELGGMGLIKNAITQGVQLGQHFGQSLKSVASDTVSDVVIVGAGPAGLATAMGLRQAGLTFRVLEQEELGGTIAHYPRQKVVMTARVDLPIVGKFGKTYMSKEELLEAWEHATKKANVQVERGTKVERIDGQDGAFEVQTTKGRVRARKVVLAIGRRGTPRRLGAPGDDLSKVTYRLIDAQQYEGTRVLIVGGGDSALEAAIQIADETSAQVSLSYRNAELGKARVANKQRFAALVEEGRIQAFMPSTVKEVTPDAVVLDDNGTPIHLENDYIIACLGGELPSDFLKTNGVSMRRLHGESLDGGARAARGSAKPPDKTEVRQRRLALGLFALGAAIFGVLLYVGQEYYSLPVAERPQHSAHPFLKPAGPWGHGVGIVATLFMMSNFLYALRKRWDRLKGGGSIKTWMTFHQFVGFMSPLVIAFHAAFQSNNLLATLTAISLVVVVLTGVVGRFLFGLVPSGGKQNELAELKKQYEKMQQSISTEIEATSSDIHRVGDVVANVTGTHKQPSLFAFLLHRPRQWLKDRLELLRVKKLFTSKKDFAGFQQHFLQLRLLQTQVTFYRALKQLMGVWRVLHVVLALCLVVMIAAHIGLSLFLGYKWIF